MVKFIQLIAIMIHIKYKWYHIKSKIQLKICLQDKSWIVFAIASYLLVCHPEFIGNNNQCNAIFDYDLKKVNKLKFQWFYEKPKLLVV